MEVEAERDLTSFPLVSTAPKGLNKQSIPAWQRATNPNSSELARVTSNLDIARTGGASRDKCEGPGWDSLGLNLWAFRTKGTEDVKKHAVHAYTLQGLTCSCPFAMYAAAILSLASDGRPRGRALHTERAVMGVSRPRSPHQFARLQAPHSVLRPSRVLPFRLISTCLLGAV